MPVSHRPCLLPAEHAVAMHFYGEHRCLTGAGVRVRTVFIDDLA